MSTRNITSTQRRPHRERPQPLERQQKWGLLEKKNDYKLRAADHKVKKRKLALLQQKARERNEDEFYFGMVGSETRGGIKVAKRGEGNGGGVLESEVVKLMKTQDVGYLRTMLQQTRRERERVEEEVVGQGVGVSLHPSDRVKRVVFGEDGEPLVKNDEKGDVDDSASSEDDVEEDNAQDNDPKLRALKKKRRKLAALEDRERDLAAALREVEEQRAKMSGSTGGVNKDGVKFRVRQRKR